MFDRKPTSVVLPAIIAAVVLLLVCLGVHLAVIKSGVPVIPASDPEELEALRMREADRLLAHGFDLPQAGKCEEAGAVADRLTRDFGDVVVEFGLSDLIMHVNLCLSGAITRPPSRLNKDSDSMPRLDERLLHL